MMQLEADWTERWLIAPICRFTKSQSDWNHTLCVFLPISVFLQNSYGHLPSCCDTPVWEKREHSLEMSTPSGLFYKKWLLEENRFVCSLWHQKVSAENFTSFKNDLLQRFSFWVLCFMRKLSGRDIETYSREKTFYVKHKFYFL